MVAKAVKSSSRVWIIAGVVLVLNLTDAILTLFWIDMGIAREGNPLLQWALSIGPGCFVFIKFGTLFLSLAILVPAAFQKRFAFDALWASAGIYSILLAYHLTGIARCFPVWTL